MTRATDMFKKFSASREVAAVRRLQPARPWQEAESLVHYRLHLKLEERHRRAQQESWKEEARETLPRDLGRQQTWVGPT